MTFLAAYIMRGRMQAMLVASTLALLSLVLPPVSFVSSASVSLVTLRRGGREGMYVLLCACLSAAILGFFIFGSYQFALLYSLVLWLPIWLISIVLREGQHLSVAMLIAVLIGIVSVIGFYLFASDPASIWHPIANEMVKLMLYGRNDVPVEDVQEIVQMLSRYMTGGMAAGAIMFLMLCLFLARWWQSALYNPGGFREEYLSLSVHPKVAIASILVVAFALFMPRGISEICWNITIVISIMYAFAGTAILHGAFSKLKGKRIMVPFLYITLILIRYTIIISIVVGFLDVWMDLRSKFSNNTRT